MNVVRAIILGIVQGLTEFIPVSSSGHLALVGSILGGCGDNFHLFLEFINFGTVFALLIFFRKYIIKIFRDVFVRRDYKIAFNIVLTSIPAGIIGFFFADMIENNDFFNSIIVMAVALGIIGILMIFVGKLPHLSRLKNENELTPGRALGIGVAQAVALIPGASRAGTTIVAGRVVGLNSISAVRYSFLASIPVMVGVCLRLLVSGPARAYMAANLGFLLVSNLFAFIFGLLALFFVFKFLQKPRALEVFGYYRVILALVILIAVLM